MAIRTDTIATSACSPQEIQRQIGIRVLMSCGARDFEYLRDGLRFKVGLGQRRMKIVIKYQPNDLYAVERIRLPRNKFEYISEDFVEDMFAEDLPRIVLRLGDV